MVYTLIPPPPTTASAIPKNDIARNRHFPVRFQSFIERIRHKKTSEPSDSPRLQVELEALTPNVPNTVIPISYIRPFSLCKESYYPSLDDSLAVAAWLVLQM